MNQFFDFDNFRDFLRARYDYLKVTRRGFSARSFAQRAGLKSQSFFQMVVDGKRQLTPETAERFCSALGLSPIDSECLKIACAVERNDDAKMQQKFIEKLSKLKRMSRPNLDMAERHVEILSDLVNLKLYLLAQSRSFRLSPSWIAKHMPERITDSDLEERIAALIDSGLWVKDGNSVRTMAPTIRSGDAVHRMALRKTHENMLDAAKACLSNSTDKERMVGGRTFLFDPTQLPAAKAKIDNFRSEMESEFECLDSARVYQLHIAFFELERSEHEK